MLILSLLANALAAEPAPATPAAVLDSRAASGFADTLMSAGDPYNALTWYRLALYLEPSRPDADALRFRQALAYERGERFPAAVFAYGQVGGALADDAAYRSALADFHAGNPLSADVSLERLPLFFPDSEWVPAAGYLRGVLALQSKDLDAAVVRFESFNAPSSTFAPRAAALAAAAREPIPHKAPLLAGALSVVPGLGQLYGGHPGDAAMAAIVNIPVGVTSALLLRDGIQTGRSGTLVAGAILGGAFVITYPSNLLGAYRGALRANEHNKQRRAEALLGQAWDPALMLDPDDVPLP